MPKINFYIKTTRRNYVINLSVSTLVYLVFILSTLHIHEFILSVFPLVIFCLAGFILIWLPVFRVIETMQTGKYIWFMFYDIRTIDARFFAFGDIVCIITVFYISWTPNLLGNIINYIKDVLGV